jgi:hypothetical protein
LREALLRAPDGDSGRRVPLLLANRRARAQPRDIGTCLYGRAYLKLLIGNGTVFAILLAHCFMEI